MIAPLGRAVNLGRLSARAERMFGKSGEQSSQSGDLTYIRRRRHVAATPDMDNSDSIIN